MRIPLPLIILVLPFFYLVSSLPTHQDGFLSPAQIQSFPPIQPAPHTAENALLQKLNLEPRTTTAGTKALQQFYQIAYKRASSSLPLRLIATSEKTLPITDYTLTPNTFNIQSFLGQGANGQVYKAQWSDGSIYAAKEGRTAEIATERDMYAYIQHSLPDPAARRNIINMKYVVYDGSTIEGKVDGKRPQFLIEDYCNRGSVATARTTVGFDEEMLLDMMRQLAAGLRVVHENGICHDHFYTQNIFWTDDPVTDWNRDAQEMMEVKPGRFTVKIGDFGAAQWRVPNQAENGIWLSNCLDIHNLATLLHWLATGEGGVAGLHSYLIGPKDGDSSSTLLADRFTGADQVEGRALSEDFTDLLEYVLGRTSPTVRVTAQEIEMRLGRLTRVYRNVEDEEDDSSQDSAMLGGG